MFTSVSFENRYSTRASAALFLKLAMHGVGRQKLRLPRGLYWTLSSNSQFSTQSASDISLTLQLRGSEIIAYPSVTLKLVASKKPDGFVTFKANFVFRKTDADLAKYIVRRSMIQLSSFLDGRYPMNKGWQGRLGSGRPIYVPSPYKRSGRILTSLTGIDRPDARKPKSSEGILALSVSSRAGLGSTS